MPKRDEDYMAAQRQGIATAALALLADKGYYETSIRDVCKAAGVSRGALYVHFPTRESLILAAFASLSGSDVLDHIPNDWEEYVRPLLFDHQDSSDLAWLKRVRLGLQFAAEQSLADRNFGDVSELYGRYRDYAQRALLNLKQRGVITLPCGPEQTVEMHLHIATGGNLQATIDKDADRLAVIDAMRTSLALTAGLVGDGRRSP